jgi:hypothetical protein
MRSFEEDGKKGELVVCNSCLSKLMNRFNLILAVGAGLLILPITSRGSTLVTNAGSPQTATYGGTVGYQFDMNNGVDQPLDALGIYYGSGLSAAHDVGLWTVGGTLLAEVSVGPTGTPDSAGFIYTPVTPVDFSNGFDGILAAGTQYRIGADYSTGDKYVNDNGSPTFDPSVTVAGSYYSSGGGFAYPGQGDAPNTGSSAPTPSLERFPSQPPSVFLR